MEGHLIGNHNMKTHEKMNFGFESDLQFKNKYAFSTREFRMHLFQNQNFVVPWQIVEKGKKEVRVD